MSRSHVPQARALGLAALLIASAVLTIAPTAAAQGGTDTLVIAMQKDIGNYNFFDIASNTVWKASVVENFWDPLSDVDTNGDVYPRLAESWTTISDDPASPDYLKVRVTLRPDVKFSDGRPLTADDVVFSYVAQRHAGVSFSSFIVAAFDADDDGKATKAEVENGVKKVDDRTIEFSLAKKYGQFYKTTLGIPIIPKHVWVDHLKSDAACEVCLDTQWSDPAALVGSGPWKFREGVADSRYVIERNDLFWGKDFRTPTGKHPLYSTTIRTVQFDIYANLESAILALRSGKVDHIPWSITPGHIPGLAADPATRLTFISENGYFYLAFNEKREPMNDLAFRQAVSHLIDKRTIVDVYMGGFGQAGDSHLPPFSAEWYNSSVRHYDFSKEKAKEILREAGYKGAALGNGESRTLLLPDGTAVPSIVILTPPADYDPVRIKSGEFVAKNMRELGIDVTAKPIDFNTLVGRMNGFDYQMLIIGWQLSADPVSNICDVMGARATQNYFGFWDPSTPSLDNPSYGSLGGVSSLADAPTRALVAKVEGHCKVARESFDPAVQIRAIKDAQGALSEAVPANVLYYRTNALATSATWSGWVTHYGELLNGYSLAALRKGGPAASETAPEDVLLALDAPAQVPVGADREVRVAAFTADGRPASGAQVNARIGGSSISAPSTTGTTNADGLWTFTLRGKDDGFSMLYVNATLGSRSASASQPVAGVAKAPPLLFLEGAPAKTFLAAGESTAVTYFVRDRDGQPVPGARVVVDSGLLQWGSVTTPSLTDDTGRTVATFTAPAASAMPANRHLEVTLVANADKAGYQPAKGNVLALPLVVKAGDAHDWNAVSVVSATRWAAEAAKPDTVLTFRYADGAGVGLTGRALEVEVSRPGHFVSAPTTVTTGADGLATIPLVWKDAAVTRAATIRVSDPAREDALSASATILYDGKDGRTGVYGGWLEMDRRGVDTDAGTPITATVHLYGLNDKPAVGSTPLALVVGATPFGQLATLDAGAAYTYSSVDDAAAIQATTGLDGRAFTTSGSFLGSLAAAPTGPYASWAELGAVGYTGLDAASMAPATAQNGVWTFQIDPAALPLADRKAEVVVVPGGTLGHFVTDDERNFYWTLSGETAFGADYAVWRTAKILGVRWDTANPLLRTAGDSRASELRVEVVDQDNQPVPDATARVYHNGLLPRSRWPFGGASGATDAQGRFVSTVTSDAGSGFAARNGPHNAFGRHDLFIGAQKAGYASVIGSSHALIAPLATELRLSSSAVRLSDPAGLLELSLEGKDENGAPLANWSVSVSALKGTFEGLVNGTTKLDADGKGKVLYRPPAPSVVPYAFDTVKVSGSRDLYLPAVASASFAVVNAIPMITVTSPTANLVTNVAAIEVTGAVEDADGVRGVQIRLDGGSFADVPVATGLSAAGFVYAVKNAQPGQHVLTVRATDQRGFSSEQQIRFTVEAPPTDAGNGSVFERLTPAPAVAAALVAVAAAGVVLRRRG